MPRKEINIQFNKTDTGLPTKDETSETTVTKFKLSVSLYYYLFGKSLNGRGLI